MSKTLFTAALAFVLSVSGLVVSAQTETLNSLDLVANVKARYDVNLQEALAALVTADSNNRVLGYKMKGSNEFKSLAQAISDARSASDENATSITFSLGGFQPGDELQFGYGNDSSFVPSEGNTYQVASDAGFHAGYDIDSFYHLDFSKDPFDGKIEILIMAEPLPPTTVTLLIALAAAAGILLYNNRRTRARFSAQA